MKVRRVFIVLLFLALSVPLLITVPRVFKVSEAVGESLYENFEPFTQAFALIQDSYADKTAVDPKKLIYGAIRGMVGTLDSFSQFMEPDDYKELMTETKGSFGGIGIEITIRENQLMVIAPIEGTPAEKAGVKAGDLIMKIDGTVTEKMTLNDAVSKMRGVPDSKVVITLKRGEEFESRDFAIQRAVIKIQSVKPGFMLSADTGYLRIGQFMETTENDLRKGLDDLRAKGMKKLVLDLRNDPGGLLDMSSRVANMFLPDGTLIVYTEGRKESQNHRFTALGDGDYMDLPMALLINHGSASASEIVAGCFQDLKRATLIGQKSFGKGSVQTIEPLSDHSALRLTTAHYFTPHGRMIHEKGIEPDIKIDEDVKPTEETKRVYEKDVFYAYARQWANSNAKKKTGRDAASYTVTQSDWKDFLKLCETEKVPLSKLSQDADRELMEKEIQRSVMVNALGDKEARKILLKQDKVVLAALEALKKGTRPVKVK